MFVPALVELLHGLTVCGFPCICLRKAHRRLVLSVKERKLLVKLFI